MKTMKKLLISIALITSAHLPETFAQGAGDQTLPDVELSTADGGKINISTYAADNKITIFCFWATWCVPCKKELNNIHEIYEQWITDYNVEIVAVSIDDSRNVAKAKAYADGQGWEYQLLFDTNQDLKRYLNFQTIPFSIITDLSGVIVDKHAAYVEGDEYVMEEKLKELSAK